MITGHDITIIYLTKSKKSLSEKLYSTDIAGCCKAYYYFIGLTGIKTEKISTEIKIRNSGYIKRY